MSLNETIVIDSSDNEYYVDKISSRQTVMEQWVKQI